MVSLGLSSNIDRFKERLKNDAGDLQFAAAYTLTKTMKDVRDAITARMTVDFDRPTAYTLRSMAYSPASKTNLEASVFPKEFAGKGTPAEKYLAPQVWGGSRNAISSERKLRAHDYLLPDEYAVPANGAPMDAYGNFKRQLWNRILGQLQAGNPDQNETAMSRKRNKAAQRERYFVPDRFNSKLKPGIYRRVKVSDTPPRWKLEAVMIFTGSPHYSKRLKYFETSDKTIDAKLGLHWDQASRIALTG